MKWPDFTLDGLKKIDNFKKIDDIWIQAEKNRETLQFEGRMIIIVPCQYIEFALTLENKLNGNYCRYDRDGNVS